MSTPAVVRVALVNDHPLVVAGLRALLAPFPQVRVVDTQVGDIDVPLERADVALFDTYAHERRKLDVIDELRTAVADRVAVFTFDGDARMVDVALAAGAAGWLSKSLEAAALVEALIRIAAGEVVVIVRGAGADGEDGPVAAGRTWPGRELGLTERESEVLMLMVEGLRNAEVAERLFIGEETVKSHVRRIFRKLDVDSRTRAVRVALDAGFRPEQI